MSTIPDIRMSGEVREVLGPEGVKRIFAASLAEARCPVCRRHVPPDGPVNVVISISGLVREVAFCHPSCAPSALMAADFDLSDLLPDVASMNMEALFIAHGPAELPVLAAERPLDAYYAPGRGAELTDLLVSTLLREGLALIPRVREAPRRLVDWRARLTPTAGGPDQLIIESAPGRLFYEGPVPLPPGWWTAVERYGWCVLYSGNHIGRADRSGVDLDTLRVAAAAATLVGARLRPTRAAA